MYIKLGLKPIAQTIIQNNKLNDAYQESHPSQFFQEATTIQSIEPDFDTIIGFSRVHASNIWWNNSKIMQIYITISKI